MVNYYVVNNTRFDDTGFAYGEKRGKINTGESIYCDGCNKPLTMLEWLPPMDVKVSAGVLGDMVYGTYSHFIVSEAFKAIYENNALVGIKSFVPVTLYEKGKIIQSRYFYPRIVLSNVRVNLLKSEIVFEGEEECETCQRAGILKNMKGLFFEDNQVIEEDIFCTKILPGDILFSQRLKDLTSGLTNFSLIKAEEYKPVWLVA